MDAWAGRIYPPRRPAHDFPAYITDALSHTRHHTQIMVMNMIDIGFSLISSWVNDLGLMVTSKAVVIHRRYI